jgi:SM-20-related protein
MITLSHDLLIEVHDDLLPDDLLKEMQSILLTSAWTFGAKSSMVSGSYPYWYREFGGVEAKNENDCSDRVANDVPVIGRVWKHLSDSIAQGHKLIRCYANGYPYGCEGTAHLDSSNSQDRTLLLYANAAWNCDWAGETIFLSSPPNIDIVAAVLPRPNRLVSFQGNIPHVARGISRLCPHLRMTLMFKTKRL